MIACDLTPLIRALWPGNTAKSLAFLAGVPVHTAREWIHRGVYKVRRKQVAALLLDELDRQDRKRAQVRAYLYKILGDQDEECALVNVFADRIWMFSGGWMAAAGTSNSANVPGAALLNRS